MSKLKNEKKSIYQELKEFYDTNAGGIYSYQNFQSAGIREYKTLFGIVPPLQTYEKNRMTLQLIKHLSDYVNGVQKTKDTLEGYLTLNPIINYYEEIERNLTALREYDEETFKKLGDFALNTVLESDNAEEVKLGLIMMQYYSIKNAKSILQVFSIHNEYLFYVIESYKKYKNLNEFIFNMAKKSKAYGKVFCVRELEPVTDDIKKWLIEEGAENETATHELLAYSILSFNIADYLSQNDLDDEGLECLSRSVSVFLSDYSLDDIENYNDVCLKLIDLVDTQGKGIYSLYVVVAMIYIIESIIIEEYSKGPDDNEVEKGKELRNIMDSAREVCKKECWHDVIREEINCIETETSVLISCIEKTGYDLKTGEFMTMLKREPSNALMYKYAFGQGSEEIKKAAFDFAMNSFNKAELLSGQDELHINDVKYEELEHVCYFIIIKYSQYKEFEDVYKSLNIEALRSPFVETRIQAVNNLTKFRGEFDSLEKEEIQDDIGSEVLMDIKSRLAYLIEDGKEEAVIKKVDVKDMIIEPHVKDIYLVTTNIKDTYRFDASPIYNKLVKEEMLYLMLDKKNPHDENAIEVVTTDGYVIGYIPQEYNLILSNLMEHDKYLYGAVENFSKDYKDITISIYLSYKDVIDEITTTLSLLSKEKEEFLQ